MILFVDCLKMIKFESRLYYTHVYAMKLERMSEVFSIE